MHQKKHVLIGSVYGKLQYIFSSLSLSLSQKYGLSRLDYYSIVIKIEGTVEPLYTWVLPKSIRKSRVFRENEF